MASSADVPREAMVPLTGMSAEEARAFAAEWLPAWTGNEPERLVAFYTHDAFYRDPAIPEGVYGRDRILAYFKKLLGKNPAWVWTHSGSISIADGFLNKWHASIPVGDETLEVDGVCTVQLRYGHIYSNEVFFDRAELLEAFDNARIPSRSFR